MIQHGDCLEVMAGMPAESVDAIVTDPPYGLEFMGKGWDKLGATTEKASDSPVWRAGHGGSGAASKTGGVPFGGGGQRVRYGASAKSMQEWHYAWAVEALRVAKPGAYLLAFGGTRTSHRLAVALEDAGWIIRDTLVWCYASGFPKGRANLKPAWEPIVMARKPGPLRHLNIEECRIDYQSENDRASAVPASPGPTWSVDGTGKRKPALNPTDKGRWPSNVLLSDPELFDEPNPWVVGSGATATSGTHGPNETRHTQGGNGRTHGGMEGVVGESYPDTGGYSRFFKVPTRAGRLDGKAGGSEVEVDHLSQRDCDHEWVQWVLPEPSDYDWCPRCGAMRDMVADGLPEPYPRVLIIPKADRSDREPVLRPEGHEAGKRFSTHPTMKPTDLMRHLVRLVTPRGGTVLDPFLGSGTTALACELEGFPWIGIEKEAEYVAIAEARLNGVQRGLGLDVPAPTKAPPKTHPDLSKHQPKRRAPAENWTGGWKGHRASEGSLDMFTRTKPVEDAMSENDLRWPFGHAVDPDEEPAA